MRLYIVRKIRIAYPKGEKFGGRYGENWPLHKKSFLMICESGNIPPADIARMFRVTITDSALLLFDSNFAEEDAIQPQKNSLFTTRLTCRLSRKKLLMNWHLPLSQNTKNMVNQIRKLFLN